MQRVAASSQLVAHSSSGVLNIYDAFSAGRRACRGVDSLVATFNNYELQFFVGGCCLKKDCLCPTFGSTNSLEARFNFVWRKKRSCCCCCAWHVAKKMWQQNCKQKTKTFTTTTVLAVYKNSRKQLNFGILLAPKRLKLSRRGADKRRWLRNVMRFAK